MMGQQQQTMVAEQQAGSALRRVLLALTVAVLMAVLMAASAMPALGKGGETSEVTTRAKGAVLEVAALPTVANRA